MNKEYKFILFPLNLFTSTFKNSSLEKILSTFWKDGFKMRSKEFSIEPYRVLGFIQKLAFGILFERDPLYLENEKSIKVLSYNDSILSNNINIIKLREQLNQIAMDGYDLNLYFQYQARHGFFFLRNNYIFIFAKDKNSTIKTEYKIHIYEHEYRYWTQTINQSEYEKDLNYFLRDKELKCIIRGEKSKIGGLMKVTSSIIIAQSSQALKTSGSA